MKPVLLICGCQKYRPYLDAAIRRFASSDYEIIGLIASVTESYDATTQILTVAAPDTYEGLPQKLHAAFRWIQANRPGIPGVFKTDDDLIVDVGALTTNIAKNAAIPYWGFVVATCQAEPVSLTRIQERFVDKSLRPSHQKAAYCLGWGYWLSSEALAIAVAAPDYATSHLEDVCTGHVMNRAGITPRRFRVPYREAPRSPELLGQR